MKKFGVSFHLIEPGFFKTNIIKIDQRKMDAFWNVYKGLPQSTKDEYGEECMKDGELLPKEFSKKFQNTYFES